MERQVRIFGDATHIVRFEIQEMLDKGWKPILFSSLGVSESNDYLKAIVFFEKENNHDN